MRSARKGLRGMSTFELLLAFSVLTLTLTAVISMLYGNQTAVVDTQTGTEALARAQKFIEKERVLAASNFLAASSTSSTETVGTLTYSEAMAITDVTPCKKKAVSTITWNALSLRPQKVKGSSSCSDG